MAKFNYKKWITENKHGKNPFNKLYEQGTADFEVKEQNTGSGFNPPNTGSGTTGGNTGSGTTGGNTGSGFNPPNTGSGTTGSNTGSGFNPPNTGSNFNPPNTGSAGTGNIGASPSGSITTNVSIQGGPYPGNWNPQGWYETFTSKIKGFKDERRLCKYLNGVIQNWTVKMNSGTTGPKTDNLLLAKIQMTEQLMSEIPCDDMREMYTYEETTGTYMKENKKITKRRLKNIIKEELKKSLLKEQSCRPTTPCGENFKWSTIECKCVPIVNYMEQTTSECSQIQALSSFMMCCENTSQWTTPASTWTDECKNVSGLAGNIHPNYATCCTSDGDPIGHDDPNEGCKDPEIGRSCWYCKSPTSTPGCIQVMNGSIPWSNPFPLPLYMDQQDCMDAEGCPDETGTGTSTDMKRCECCKNGNPISMQTMIPASDSCVGAENTVYAGLGVYGCNEQGATQCKKVPTGGDLPSGETPMMAKKASDDVEKSRELREMINKELFKK